MESARLSKSELIDIIFYALKENNIDVKEIKQREIETIIDDYYILCSDIQASYVRGELDTFKRAACLLVAINRRYLSKNRKVNASIALDAAYKMCEKPYWNVGENFDIPKKLEEVEYKKAFENDMGAYNKSKELLIYSLIYEKGFPLNYSLNLELFYHVALELKHHPREKSNDINSTEEKTGINKLEEVENPQLNEETNLTPTEGCKQRKRIFGIFRR